MKNDRLKPSKKGKGKILGKENSKYNYHSRIKRKTNSFFVFLDKVLYSPYKLLKYQILSSFFFFLNGKLKNISSTSKKKNIFREAFLQKHRSLSSQKAYLQSDVDMHKDLAFQANTCATSLPVLLTCEKEISLKKSILFNQVQEMFNF